MQIKYVSEPFTVVKRPVKGRTGAGVYGYGQKISTARLIQFCGSKRLHRVYATCFSNVASHWITKDRQKLYIGDWQWPE